MYNFPYYKAEDDKEAIDFIKQNPFAFLTGCDAENKPIATQVPIFIEENDGRTVIRGHLMKNTDHHKAMLQNSSVLLVFSGKNCYVSGSWYSNPNTASTWNYMSVQVKGIIHFLDDDELKNIMRKTTLHFEKDNHDSPTVFDNLPDSFKKHALPMIAGFEIEIQDLDTVFKLSQDKDEESYKNIIERLKNKDADSRVIAEEMEKRWEKLFS